MPGGSVFSERLLVGQSGGKLVHAKFRAEMEQQEHQAGREVPGISPPLLELVGVLREVSADVCRRLQRAAQGMHNLQLSLGLEKVSPAPCPSHSFLVKIQTNFRDRLEHTALFGLCPLQPVSTFVFKRPRSLRTSVA